jgi:peptide/histidine transporter 3/4
MMMHGWCTQQVLFLTRELGYSSAAADAQTSIWSGVCFVTPLLGGWMADSFFGRYCRCSIVTFVLTIDN